MEGSAPPHVIDGSFYYSFILECMITIKKTLRDNNIRHVVENKIVQTSDIQPKPDCVGNADRLVAG